ncbi:MAG: S41 family peptidase [Actinomycetota bacterium]|nr:S41 family peptidase [Actinomycetota bacterium]
MEEARAAGARRFVLDLRGNAGGELEQAVLAAGLFLDGGSVVYVREEAGGERERVLSPAPEAFGASGRALVGEPLVVLVDGGSASSSEILASALRDNGRATLVGETTMGTGTVLAEFPLEDGSSVLLGVAEWLTPEGDFIRESGISPDIEVAVEEDGEALSPEQIDGMTAGEIAGRDAQLGAALRETGLRFDEPGSRR